MQNAITYVQFYHSGLTPTVSTADQGLILLTELIVRMLLRFLLRKKAQKVANSSILVYVCVLDCFDFVMAMYLSSDFSIGFDSDYHFVLQVAFEVAIFLLSDVWNVQVLGGLNPPFALLTAIHVGLWLIAVLLDRYMHYHHRMLRTFGYLDFYTKTKDIRRLPLWILSLGKHCLLTAQFCQLPIPT